MYKVLVIGDIRVGKTSFVHRLVNNLFKDNYKCTLGGKRKVRFVLYCIIMKYCKLRIVRCLSTDGQTVRIAVETLIDRCLTQPVRVTSSFEKDFSCFKSQFSDTVILLPQNPKLIYPTIKKSFSYETMRLQVYRYTQ